MLDLVLNACKADIDYLTSLLSPDRCKARMLPLLSNYVGYTYDYAEKVKTNRIITKNWPTLIRNRGSITGIRLATSIALCQLEDVDTASIYELFDVYYDTERDRHGREMNIIRIYMYQEAYLSKLYDLIEAVRPAGTYIEIIPSIPIHSSETIVLTDEYKMVGYDYCTGKLIKIGDVPIYVENSWQIMKDGISTGEYLVDGVFYDTFHNPLGYSLDMMQKIVDKDGNLTGEVIRAPRIYRENSDGTLSYTGKYFNLDHAARVLNTCYELRSGGKALGYFIYADSWVISDATKSNIQFYLKDYDLDGLLVKKVYGKSTDIKYNWHVDLESGYFIQDNDGEAITSTIPWDDSCYIGKKRYVMNTSPAGIMYTTDYFVNKYEDIQDSAGNIILSKKDRYKVSDSTSIGFSEVHSMDKCTTYDKTWIYARDRAYRSDRDYYNNYLEKDYNDYTSDSGFVDNRILITPGDIDIDLIYREYEGTNHIGSITVDSTSIVEGNKATIPIDDPTINGEEDIGIETSSSNFYINVTLRKGDNVLSVFKEIDFTFDGSDAGDHVVFMHYKLSDDCNKYYNTSLLPERLAFPGKGRILKKKLRFNTNSDIRFTGKTYDNTTSFNGDLKE